MSSKLAELFQKKHYWEVKRDDLYNRILWDYQASAVWLIFLGFYVLLFMQRGSLFLSDVKWSWEWYNVLRILVFVIGMFFWLLNLVRNISDCYYKLPLYRKKISQLDHMVIEEFKKTQHLIKN